MRLSELEIGDSAEILNFEDEQIALLLNEMGFFPGENIELLSRSPLGDPLCIKTEDTLLSIRKHDAQSIIVQKK